VGGGGTWSLALGGTGWARVVAKGTHEVAQPDGVLKIGISLFDGEQTISKIALIG
jgi:hypothetical protein